MKFTESTVEDAALGFFKELGYDYRPGPEIAHDGLFAERTGYEDVVLGKRLRDALARINPKLPPSAIEDAFRKITRPASPSLIINNRVFHKMVTDGVDVQYRNKEGRDVTDKAWLFSADDLDKNDWLVVNQFTVVENHVNRRPDIVVFVNGLPVAVIELKNAADENATVQDAYNQLQTYMTQIPSLFTFNEALVISDGVEARLGTVTAPWERFSPWRTVKGNEVAGPAVPLMEVLIQGVFDKCRFLDLIQHFVTFEDDGGKIAKKQAAYHQYHAVNVAVGETVRASSPKGDKRVGVVWHTQGSGKSLTMLFYAGRIVDHPAMQNPTIVVITDRNDLDDQLFGTFSRGQDLLRQTPVQAESREHIKELLKVASGGVVFTTIQKFMPAKGETYPLLSDRRNIVVIADEAHRSQYDFIDGFARHMRDALPNASFVGFTGTPIELADRSTIAVFGDHISVYDIEQAIEDGVTVRIYYEGRLAKIELQESERPRIDPEFQEITEQEELSERSRLARKWSGLEAMVGTEKRLGLIAKDIVDHFDKRQDVIDGKAMIVCMSRRVCVDLYNQIVKLRPQWDSQDFAKGGIKVVMTGSASDPEHYRRHLMTGQVRTLIEKRFKDPADPLKVVIVRDMWLTGFDVPCLHTMYVDKPMKGHSLMQTIARVNRVFRDKPGGLIVDYLGIAEELKEAVANYAGRGGRGKPTFDQEEAVAIMLEKHEILVGIFDGFDWTGFIRGVPSKKLGVLKAAVEHVLLLKEGKERVIGTARQLVEAFALSVPHPEALRIKDDVGFFQAVKAQLMKLMPPSGGMTGREIESAIKQLVSKAVTSDKVIDIFSEAGLEKPDLSILDDEFLAHFKAMPQKNLAIEMLRKLLSDEIRTQARANLVLSRSFAQMLEETVRKYQNRSLEAAQVIAELVQMAKEFKMSMKRGQKLGLTDAELAFYDALGTNDSAVRDLGDDTLKAIAQDLVKGVRSSVTIDWTVKDAVRARMRTMIKRILRKYNYPPDKQEQATQTVIQQAELLCSDWAA